jgi:hypothetical protein
MQYAPTGKFKQFLNYLKDGFAVLEDTQYYFGSAMTNFFFFRKRSLK